jgi:hypothetical protein
LNINNAGWYSVTSVISVVHVVVEIRCMFQDVKKRKSEDDHRKAEISSKRDGVKVFQELCITVYHMPRSVEVL